MLEHNTSPVKFVVIDNGSSPEQLAALRQVMDRTLPGYAYIADGQEPEAAPLPHAALIRSDKNLGYARGNNFGLRHVYADPEISHILVLNNDILFTEDMIPALRSAYKQLPGCAILSPLLKKKGNVDIDFNCARRSPKVSDLIKRNFLFYWWLAIGKKYAQARPDLFLIKGDGSDPDVVEVEMPSGSCMLVDKAYFESIGGFDPHTFLYYEENILHKKVERTGKRIYLTTGVSCIHLGAQTIGNAPDQLKHLKHSMQAEDYYIMTYSGANLAQKAVYKLSKWVLFTTTAVHRTLQKLLK